jgi:aromatic aminotransferase
MQGVVYWQPPESVMNKVKEIIWEPSISKYGSDDGLPELREALLEKVFLSIMEYRCSYRPK